MRDKSRVEKTLPLPGGTLSYWTTGTQGPWLVCLSGFVPGPLGWRAVSTHFSARYRVLVPRYRGLVAGMVGGPEQHARDVVAIMDAEGIAAATVISHGAGVSVAVELSRGVPGIVRRLVLIGGGVRQPWRIGGESGLPTTLLPRVLDLARRVPTFLAEQILTLLRGPEAYLWARRLGLLGGNADEEVFAAVCSEFSMVSPEAFVATLDHFASHDGSELLKMVGVPTLVVSAGADLLTPRESVEALVSGISQAQYCVLPNATHFVLMDHADHLNLRLEKFLAEHVERVPDQTSEDIDPEEDAC